MAKGDSEMAIQPVSELLHVPGVDFVGPIPKRDSVHLRVQRRAGGRFEEATAMASKLIEFLGSDSGRAAMKNHGMEPLG